MGKDSRVNAWHNNGELKRVGAAFMWGFYSSQLMMMSLCYRSSYKYKRLCRVFIPIISHYSTMAEKQTFVVWAPAHTGPEALGRRVAVRPAHLQHLGELTAQGSLKLGGPISDPESGDASGSMIVFEAESVAAVRKILENDPYWKADFWDKERIEIRTINLTIVGTGAGH